MQFLYRFLGTFFKDEDDRERLAKVIVPSFAIQSTAVLLGLITSFILARGLGADKYGVFTFAFSFVFPLVNFASFGISILMVREIPTILAKDRPGLLKGLHKWSLWIVLPACLLLTALLVAIVYYLPLTLQSRYRIPIFLAALVIPFYGLMHYYSASLRGLHKILLSQIADNIIRPGSFVLLIVFLYFFSNNFGVHSVIYANIIAFALAMGFAAIVFYKSIHLKSITPEYDNKKWWKSLGSLSILNGILSLDSRLDILLLGFIKTSTQVGAYNIAHKIALTLYFFLSVMNTVIAPSVSRLHSVNNKARLQEMLTKTVRWVTALSLPVGILIICFSKWIMLYFGKDFEEGQAALIILCAAQLFSISCGSVGLVSVMTGHEKYNSIGTLLSIAVTVVLSLILIPYMGLTGSAIATAASIVVWNIYMVIIVKKKVGVYPWIYKLN